MDTRAGDQRHYIDTVRLSREERDALLAQLSRTSGGEGGAERRRQERQSYRKPAGLIMQMHGPGGATENYLVRARNLSGGGIGFLHGAAVEAGTLCVLALMRRDCRIVRVEGRVVRCQHVGRHIHDVGVMFEQDIEPGEYVVGEEAQPGEARPSSPLPRLGGRALCIVESAADHELLAFYLPQLGVEARIVSDGGVGIQVARRAKFNAVLTAMRLQNMSGSAIGKLLLQGGYGGPIIALADDEDESARLEAIQSGCNYVLVKPYNLEELTEVLVHYWGGDGH